MRRDPLGGVVADDHLGHPAAGGALRDQVAHRVGVAAGQADQLDAELHRLLGDGVRVGPAGRQRDNAEPVGVRAHDPAGLGADRAGRPQQRDGAGGAHGARPTYFVSRYSSMPSAPPSRPSPEALTPPNGAAGLEISPWLTPTIP